MAGGTAVRPGLSRLPLPLLRRPPFRPQPRSRRKRTTPPTSVTRRDGCAFRQWRRSRRLLESDVVAYQRADAEKRQAALDALTEEAQRQGLGYP
jgi:hypothetical protein